MTIVGNVAGDVTKRRTASGDVVNFRVMSSERRYDSATGEWQDGAQFAARVTCWRRLAENVHKCVVKGDPVVINGKLAVREYEVDGQRRSSTEIEARSVGLDLRKVAAGVVPDDRAADGSTAPVDVTSLTEVPADAPMFRAGDAASPLGGTLVPVGVDGSVDSLLDDAEDDEFVHGAMAS